MEYLTTIKDKKGINKDTWKMVLEFEHNVGGELSKHKEGDFWPILIDNFVEFLK